MVMNADSAAAIASVCAALVAIATVVGQVLLARQISTVKQLVNGQSHSLTQLAADKAFRQGVDVGAGVSHATVAEAPPLIEPK